MREEYCKRCDEWVQVSRELDSTDPDATYSDVCTICGHIVPEENEDGEDR